MRVECALLCDAANVRDGLLHVLGGGITTVGFTSFPDQLPLTFALRVLLEPRSLSETHVLTLELVDASSERLESQLTVEFTWSGEEFPNEEVAIATPISLQSMRIPRIGRYQIKATLDKEVLGSYPLRVTQRTADQ